MNEAGPFFSLVGKGEAGRERPEWCGPCLKVAQMETVELAREHSSHYSLTPHPWPLMAYHLISPNKSQAHHQKNGYFLP